MPARRRRVTLASESAMKSRHVMVAVLLGFAALAAAGAQPPVEKGYDDPAVLARLIQEGKTAYVLVDVRTAAEYEAGHMMYVHADSLAKLMADVARFIREALGR